VTEGRWQVSIDSGTCIGSGVCAGTAPAYFTLDGGYGTPVANEVDPNEDVVNAAESCPMEAILVRENGTDKVIAPVD
jgi:ferredoxin